MLHGVVTPTNRRFRFPLHVAIPCTILTFCLGCAQPQPELVPQSENQPMMTYLNSSPRFRLNVFMYAPGNLLFHLQNLLADFDLQGLPAVSSSTGRVLQPRFAEEGAIEFNLLLPDNSYTLSSEDVTVTWVLEEKGPGAFLRSEGKILVDVASSSQAAYFVKSVRYLPAADLPNAAYKAP